MRAASCNRTDGPIAGGRAHGSGNAASRRRTSPLAYGGPRRRASAICQDARSSRIGQVGRPSPWQRRARVSSVRCIACSSRIFSPSSAACARASCLTSALARCGSSHNASSASICLIANPSERALDEAQPVQVGFVVQAVVGEGARSRRDQSDAFVVADHLRRHAGERRGLADVVQARLQRVGQFRADGRGCHVVLLRISRAPAATSAAAAGHCPPH